MKTTDITTVYDKEADTWVAQQFAFGADFRAVGDTENEAKENLQKEIDKWVAKFNSWVASQDRPLKVDTIERKGKGDANDSFKITIN